MGGERHTGNLWQHEKTKPLIYRNKRERGFLGQWHRSDLQNHRIKLPQNKKIYFSTISRSRQQAYQIGNTRFFKFSMACHSLNTKYVQIHTNIVKTLSKNK